jgi:hypothetical protein
MGAELLREHHYGRSWSIMDGTRSGKKGRESGLYMEPRPKRRPYW